MTQPPDLDDAAKARIDAEERYRAEVRAGQAAGSSPATPPPLPPAAPVKKKRGCGFWILVVLGVILALAIIGSILPKPPGSTTDTNQQSSPTATTSTNESSTPPTSTDTTPAATQDTPTTQEQDGGATLESDGSQSIGVWRISDLKWNTTRNVGGEFGTSAGEGETFVRVQFTLQNTTKETQNFSSLIDQPQVITADGSSIDADTMLSIEGSDQMIDGQIAPGLKRKGLYAFRVPTSQLSGMKFQLQFFGGKFATWSLSN